MISPHRLGETEATCCTVAASREPILAEAIVAVTALRQDASHATPEGGVCNSTLALNVVPAKAGTTAVGVRQHRHDADLLRFTTTRETRSYCSGFTARSSNGSNVGKVGYRPATISARVIQATAAASSAGSPSPDSQMPRTAISK